MTLEALAGPTPAATDTMFDFSRRVAEPLAEPAAALAAELAGCRPEPQAGWARRNPERAMLFLFLTPREGIVVDELLAS